MDLSLVVGIDYAHLDQLTYSLPTWLKYKPKITRLPLVVIYDAYEISVMDKRLKLVKKAFSHLSFVPWKPPINLYSDQREKMLTALVTAPRHVKTEWYVQIDTDVYAKSNESWTNRRWFRNPENVIVSNPWGYTKPANALETLDDWGDKVDLLKPHPRLNVFYDPKSDLVSYPRIASWIIFAKTNFSLSVIDSLDKVDGHPKLPVPSQDTLLWYCAARSKKGIVKFPFREAGWNVAPTTGKLKQVCTELK